MLNHEFELIEEYIKKSKEERQKHLDLNESCLEIGGHSFQFRGLMAYTLKTTIPTRQKVVLAHACHNGKCSNPRHLYWATYGENMHDAINSGSRPHAKGIWFYSLRKYGLEKIKEMASIYGKKGSKAAKENLIKKHGIKEAKEIMLESSRKGGKKGGRILADRKIEKFLNEDFPKWKEAFENCEVHKFGWIERVKKYVDIERSHTQIRRIAKKYFKNMNFYKRKSLIDQV